MPATLLIGYDGSECAQVALQRTAELANLMPGAHVIVVYAFEFSVGYVPSGMTGSPLMMSAEFDDHIKLVRDYGESRVADAARVLKEAGVSAETLVVEGRPVDVLLREAKDREATLIVVGSHGEGAMSAAFLGSTALKLLHHSDVPVLVVPRRDRDS
jgi:nucleotide-binding universal stress UspA family protein